MVARGKVTKEVAEALGLEFGEAASQSALEAWTVLLAIRYWSSTLKGKSFLLKSDRPPFGAELGGGGDSPTHGSLATGRSGPAPRQGSSQL